MSLVLNDYYMILIGTILELLIVCVFTYALAQTRWFHSTANGKFNPKNCVILIATFTILAIMATTYFSFNYIDNTKISVRDFPAMVSGLIGGPIVGICVGLLGGLERYFVGGPAAIPCMMGTILAGLTGGIIWYIGGKKFPKFYIAAIAMLIVEFVHMILICYLYNPADGGPSGTDIASTIAPAMILCNVLCILVFSIIYNMIIEPNIKYRE